MRAETIVGPPGCGKTTALAARAAQFGRIQPVAVICSHDASCDAFRSALAEFDAPHVNVRTLAGHVAGWMREDFAASGAAPDLAVGGDADSRALLQSAARSVLDMTWEGFRVDDFTLDLPFLSRPDSFLDEAASLFRQLRRSCVAPDEFEAGCIAGAVEFYGDGVERARALCADPEARARASRRGCDAMSARTQSLAVQKRAERDLASLLAHSYREYRTAAAEARILCPEDVVDSGLEWLRRDGRARSRIAKRIAAIIVDDAEDADPGVGAIVGALATAGLESVTIAGSAESAIDGFGGRRSALRDFAGDQRDLPPRASRISDPAARRLDDETAEADFIAQTVGDFLSAGTPAHDVVVLSRDEAGAAVYARLLAERGIPITVHPDAWQSPREIADLLALACVVDDPLDHAHLLRVLASPVVGLSDASICQLCREPGGAAQLSLDMGAGDDRGARGRAPTSTTLADNVLTARADHLLNADGRANLVAFREQLRVWRTACAALPPAAVLPHLAGVAGFVAEWERRPAYVRARLADDIKRLTGAAATVDGGLRNVAAALEDGSTIVRSATDVLDAVACRTIVGAKGRRWQAAVVAGVAHERFPRIYVARAMAFSRKYGLIVRENVAGGAAQSAKFAWYYAKFGAKGRFLEEERRALAYGLSRGERAAFATGFGKPPRWSKDHDFLAALGA